MVCKHRVFDNSAICLTDSDRMQRRIHNTELQINFVRQRIQDFQSRIVRTVNSHRQMIIEELCPDLIPQFRGPQGARIQMSSSRISSLTHQLINDGLLTSLQDMKDRADQKKTEICQDQTRHSEYVIRKLEEDISQYRQQLQEML